MKLGIIGLPGAGKTTIFNALTRGDAPVAVAAETATGAGPVVVFDPGMALQWRVTD